jgi:hypothetical protein
MGNLRQNYTDEEWSSLIEETKLYSGLGEEWTMTSTTDIIPNNNKKEIFRQILDEFREWEGDWIYYKINPDHIKKPMNADDFALDLSNRYIIKEL